VVVVVGTVAAAQRQGVRGAAFCRCLHAHAPAQKRREKRETRMQRTSSADKRLSMCVRVHGGRGMHWRCRCVQEYIKTRLLIEPMRLVLVHFSCSNGEVRPLRPGGTHRWLCTVSVAVRACVRTGRANGACERGVRTGSAGGSQIARQIVTLSTCH
jgi:hypothetical protein